MLPILGGIVGAAAGGLAKAAKALFSGKARDARQQRRAEKFDIASGLEQGTTPALGLFGKRKAEKAAEQKQEEAKKAAGGIMEIVKKYWWIGAIVAVIFLLPKLLGKNPVRRRSRSNSGSTFSRRMQAAKRRKARTRRK
jgi:hypothetical protein